MKLNKNIFRRKHIVVLLICSFQFSCYKDLDKLPGKKVTLIATNQTSQNIDDFKVLAYSSENQTKKLLDSVSISNLSKSTSKNIVFKNNNLGIIDGQFEIIAKFENGKIIKSDCCYFTNGTFLVNALNFSISENEISVKSN